MFDQRRQPDQMIGDSLFLANHLMFLAELVPVDRQPSDETGLDYGGGSGPFSASSTSVRNPSNTFRRSNCNWKASDMHVM